MTEEVSSELTENLAAYRSSEAVAEYSVYRLLPEEDYLFRKYYRPGESVLDLACGMGRTTLLLHEMGLTVRGIDRSDVFIRIAKRRFPYLDLRLGSYDRIEEPDASFSHVLISFNGLDCAFPVSQRISALRECARVLRPGGTLIFSSHNVKSLHWFSPYDRSRLGWKLRNGIRGFKDWDYILERGVHLHYASADLVVQQTEKAGLELLEKKGFSRIGFGRLDMYFSPYIHYVFEKPPDSGQQ